MNVDNEKNPKRDSENKLWNSYLTAKDVCQYLNVPLSTIYRLSKQGKIKAVKIGKQWRYPKKSIKEYDLTGIGTANYPSRKTDQLISQRAFPRINCNLDCRYSINIPLRKKLDSYGSIYNISGNGVLLVDKADSIDKIDIDDPITLDFHIVSKDIKYSIQVEGRVVRKNSVSLGIKFREISEDMQKEIVRYVG